METPNASCWIHSQQWKVLGSVSQIIRSSLPKVCIKHLLPWYKNIDPIRSEFCKYYASWAVVACAKLRPDRIIRIKIRVKRNFNYEHINGFVRQVPRGRLIKSCDVTIERYRKLQTNIRVKCIFYHVWVQNFVWNFKSVPCTFTQNYEVLKIWQIISSSYDILSLDEMGSRVGLL